MRKIELEMVIALKRGLPFHKSNTAVTAVGNVYLHGNHIGRYHGNGTFTVNLNTLREWPTVTTRSRLRAIGVDVYTKDYVTYIDGKPIHKIPGNQLDCTVNL